jgi:hypothetical protein
LGTGGPKVGLVDQEGRVAACTSAPTKLYILPDGGAEHDCGRFGAEATASLDEASQARMIETVRIVRERYHYPTSWGAPGCVPGGGLRLFRKSAGRWSAERPRSTASCPSTPRAA